MRKPAQSDVVVAPAQARQYVLRQLGWRQEAALAQEWRRCGWARCWRRRAGALWERGRQMERCGWGQLLLKGAGEQSVQYGAVHPCTVAGGSCCAGAVDEAGRYWHFIGQARSGRACAGKKVFEPAGRPVVPCRPHSSPQHSCRAQDCLLEALATPTCRGRRLQLWRWPVRHACARHDREAKINNGDNRTQARFAPLGVVVGMVRSRSPCMRSAASLLRIAGSKATPACLLTNIFEA